MSTATITDAATATERAEQINADAAEQFLMTARRVALGEEVGPKTIADALRDAGKAREEFEDLVGQLRHRSALRGRIAVGKQASERIALLQQQLDAANKALDDAVEAHRVACAPIQQQLAEARAQERDAMVLPTDLVRTCPCPRLRQQALALERERGAILAQRNVLRHGRASGVVDGSATLGTVDERLADLAARVEANTQAMIDF